MVVITGAAGFIGSYVARTLFARGYEDLVLVDAFRPEREYLLRSLATCPRVDREAFIPWLRANQNQVQAVIHLGARTDTTTQDWDVLLHLNLEYSKAVWQCCTEYQIPLIYASSAATYGDGSHGFSDDVSLIPRLQPLNLYGQSKQDFDVWALSQQEAPFFWAGLKFFNVYGPGENHKGRMASVVWHAYHQLQRTGTITLFESHHPDYAHGGQLRDFVFVDDIASMIIQLLERRKGSGIYNAGTGQARSFLDLAKAVCAACEVPASIRFIPTPVDIRQKYQYFTEADMHKFKDEGYTPPATSLEDGIDKYVDALKSDSLV